MDTALFSGPFPDFVSRRRGVQGCILLELWGRLCDHGIAGVGSMMRATGEVMGIADNFRMAFFKA